MRRRSLITLLVMVFVGMMCATAAYAANSRPDFSRGSHGGPSSTATDSSLEGTSTITADSTLEGTSTNTTDSGSVGTSSIACTGGECFGTDGDDILQESPGDWSSSTLDQIYGMGGNDEIRGYTCLIGDAYDVSCETISYASDTDVLSGGDGSDLVDAGDADTLDTVSGGAGSNDTCAITKNFDTGATDTVGDGCESVTVSGIIFCDLDAHTDDPDFAGCETVRFCRA